MANYSFKSKLLNLKPSNSTVQQRLQTPACA